MKLILRRSPTGQTPGQKEVTLSNTATYEDLRALFWATFPADYDADYKLYALVTGAREWAEVPRTTGGAHDIDVLGDGDIVSFCSEHEIYPRDSPYLICTRAMAILPYSPTARSPDGKVLYGTSDYGVVVNDGTKITNDYLKGVLGRAHDKGRMLMALLRASRGRPVEQVLVPGLGWFWKVRGKKVYLARPGLKSVRVSSLAFN